MKGLSSNKFWHRGFPQASPPVLLPEALSTETCACSAPAPSQGLTVLKHKADETPGHNYDVLKVT